MTFGLISVESNCRKTLHGEYAGLPRGVFIIYFVPDKRGGMGSYFVPENKGFTLYQCHLCH